MDIDAAIQPQDLLPLIARVWKLSAGKLTAIASRWDPSRGAPVFTVQGRYTSRGWTEWTEGFLHGSALLQYDATGDTAFLQLGRHGTIERMPTHVTHFGVHDHGFNVVSTYGNLRRLILEGKHSEQDLATCTLALRCSGAVQARRWTAVSASQTFPPVPDLDPTLLPFSLGYIHSFNGPHSLFVDTIRSLRSLAIAHDLGQTLMDEQDARISLLDRLCAHATSTAIWSIYYGRGRDCYDVLGRTAHESIFNPTNGIYRCPSTQQGYSPFTTWTRGLAWAMCGLAEQLEWFAHMEPAEKTPAVDAAFPLMLRAAEATCEFYIANTPRDGIPYWDTGAPGLTRLGDHLSRPADPFNDYEPVDSSAACIAAQGLLRLGRYLGAVNRAALGDRYIRAGLTVARSLFGPPYLSEDARHEGLILHSVYHRPNGWDYIPPTPRVPCGESSMWGDYHARELALLIQRLARSERYLAFYGATRP